MKVAECSARLNELMKFYGISQSDIARTTGIPKTTLSQYVLGKREPKTDALYLIAEKYRVDPVWLMGYEVPMVKGIEVDVKRETDSQSSRLLKYAAELAKLSNEQQELVFKTIDMFLKAKGE